MAKKDKFAHMKQSGGAGSFQQSLVQAATTVAAIEKQQEQIPQGKSVEATLNITPVASRVPGGEWQQIEQLKFMRLPNPQIPLAEYNLVSQYCSRFPNMTRQDFVELAIIEKLHNDAAMSTEDFDKRHEEIRNRPPRGRRKGTRNPK